LDCCVKSVFNAPTDTILTGLSHLENEEVMIVGDEATYPSQTVTEGGLPDPFIPDLTTIAVGLPFVPHMEFFQPDRDLPDGHTTGRRLKVCKVVLVVDNSKGFSVNGDINPSRSTDDAMDAAPNAETTQLTFNPDLEWNQHVTIDQPLPFPGHILAAILDVEIGD